MGLPRPPRRLYYSQRQAGSQSAPRITLEQAKNLFLAEFRMLEQKAMLHVFDSLVGHVLMIEVKLHLDQGLS